MKQKNSRGISVLQQSASKKTAAGAGGGGRKMAPASPRLEDREPRWMLPLLEAISDGALIVDEAGLVNYANRRAELLFGWDRNDLIGKSIDVLLPPGFREVHQQHRRNYMQQPSQRPMGIGREFLGHHKDGTEFRVEIGLSPFDSGAGTQVLCLVTAVGERFAAEAKGRVHQNRFEALFKAFPMPIYVWRRQAEDFILVDYNMAAEIATQAAVGHLLGRSLRGMYAENPEVITDFERSYREKACFSVTMLGFRLRSTSEVKDVVVTYLPVEPDLVLAIIEDVTAERAALAELQKLSSAVEQTADAVFITDRDGAIEYVNPGFEQITGFSRAEALGQTPRILKSGQMRPEFYQQLWKKILGGEAVSYQIVNHRRDGRPFVAAQTVTPMRDQAGQITHLVSVLKDMTETIRLQEQEIEQRLAGVIQTQLFPVQPPHIEGYDVAGAVFPAEATSGDYFDYIPMPDKTLGIVVADVCGHGMGPALLMAELRAYLHSIARHEADPWAVLRELNLELTPDLTESRFITAFLARLDPQRHVLECANAGNWPAYILGPEGRCLHELRAGGTPLGVEPDLVLRRPAPIPLAPGSLAVFLTDGIPEANDAALREFGRLRLLSVIRRHRLAPAREIIERVRAAVQKFSGATKQSDDQTIIICKRLG